MWEKETITLEFLGTFNIYVGVLIQIGFSLAIGVIIGLERELKRKPAGIKTNVMICIGATLYTSISLINTPSVMMPYDPNRIAAQIVSGIGFLGAGAIMRGHGTISGLTTAATIWVVAALGVVIGLGYPVIATLVTVVVIIVLLFINPLYELLSIKKSYVLTVTSDKSVKKLVQGILLSSTFDVVKLNEYSIDDDDELLGLNCMVVCDSKKLARAVKVIGKISSVKKVKFKIKEDID